MTTGSKSYTPMSRYGRFPGVLEMVRVPMGTAHRQAMLSAPIANPRNHDTAPVTKTRAVGSLSNGTGQSKTNTSVKRRAGSFQPVSQTVDPQSGTFTTHRTPRAGRVARSGDDGCIGNPGHDTLRRLPRSRNGDQGMNACPNSCRDIRNPFWQHERASVRDVDHAEG